MTEKEHQFELSINRFKTFSDSVFAIAITLLVLDIKVPHFENHDGNLAQGLWNLWTSYFGFVFSFTRVGIYWANHHYVFQLYKRINFRLLLLNLIFLMGISFVPFPTKVLAEYLTDSENVRTAIIFFTLGFLLPSLAWLAMWFYALKNNLLDPRLAPSFTSKLTRLYLLNSILYSTAFLISFWQPYWGLALSASMPILYARKPPEPILTDSNDKNNE